MKIVIVVPAYNEEKILANNISRLADYCIKNIIDDWCIIIADNASSDKTSVVAKELVKINTRIKYLFISQKGKGRAIREAWNSIEADIYIFMDADLASDLKSLPDLISAIKGGSDLAIGSRYILGSEVKRSFLRFVFSKFYHLILRVILGFKVSDAPCGLKAINQKIKKEVLPEVRNQEWFFDSELVILAERKKYKISEVPIAWREARVGEDKSRVNPIVVGFGYLHEVLKLRKRLK